jgi:hypothetical protein
MDQQPNQTLPNVDPYLAEQFSLQRAGQSTRFMHDAASWELLWERKENFDGIVRTYRLTTAPVLAILSERRGQLLSVTFADEKKPWTKYAETGRAIMKLYGNYDEKDIREVLKHANPRKWTFFFEDIAQYEGSFSNNEGGEANKPAFNVLFNFGEVGEYEGGNYESILFPFIENNFEEVVECTHQVLPNSPYQTKEAVREMLTSYGMRYEDPELTAEAL